MSHYMMIIFWTEVLASGNEGAVGILGPDCCVHTRCQDRIPQQSVVLQSFLNCKCSRQIAI